MKAPHLLMTSIFTLCLSPAVFAWGDLGHQTVAEIAQRQLSPKAQVMVYDLIGHGPMAEAATYPDLVRSDEDYKEFAAFHFVEIDPRWGSYEKIPAALKEKHDANSLISSIPTKIFENILSAPKYDKLQRQDLMRYLIHLVGDVHQPLHVGNGYDRGANWCQISYPVTESKCDCNKNGNNFKNTNLHSFWDSTLVDYIFTAKKIKNPSYKMPSWKGYNELADLLMKDYNVEDFKKFTKDEPLAWYKESQALHSKVYPNGSAEPSSHTYCQSLVKDENGQVVKDLLGVAKIVKASSSYQVTDNYMLESSEIIKVQILKAGTRLAGILNEMAEKNYPGSSEKFQEDKIQSLKNLLNDFSNK